MSREEDCFQSIWDIQVTVSEDSEPPSEAQIIAENRDSTFYFPKSEDFDDNWGQGSYHAPAALVEGRQEPGEEERKVFDSDILQDVLGQCEIAGFEQMEDDILTLEVNNATAASIFGELPVASTTNFIHHLHPTSSTTLLQTSSPEYSPMEAPPFSMLPPSPSPNHTDDPDYNPVQYEQYQATRSTGARKSRSFNQKRVGRPERQTPLKITEVPMKGSALLSPSELRNLKYRRMRDLNNEASKKCRQKRKEKLSVMEQVCQEEENKNRVLRHKLEQIESQVADWKIRCKDILGVSSY